MVVVMESSYEFRVPEEEMTQLKQVASRDETVARLWKFNKNGANVIRLTRAQSEELRKHLTKQLAAMGFDKNYSLNEQGKILERLIDRFYIP
jgi:hypothetical protein